MDEIDSDVLKNFDLAKRIGKGSYGFVYKAFDKKSNKFFALKKIYDAFRDEKDAQKTYREIFLLKQLDHPNIIKINKLQKSINDKDIYVGFELMETDLHTVIRSNILEPIHRKYAFFQLLRSIVYLHQLNIIHRDIKPSNILMNSNGVIKLSDFGNARTLNCIKFDESNLMTEYVSTRWYRSPELLLGSKKYSKEADMWALGCVFAEMIGGNPAFPGTSTISQLNKILEITGKPSKEDINSLQSDLAAILFESISSIKTESLKTRYKNASNLELELLNALLQFNPSRRLTAKQTLEHVYFSDLRQHLEIEVDTDIKINLSLYDNVKYSIDDYRKELYKFIDKDKKDKKIKQEKKEQDKEFENSNMQSPKKKK